MKVLLFSADYWPDPGGIAAHVYYLSRALTKAGAEVTVVGGHLAPLLHPSDKPQGPGTFREILIQRKGPRFLRGLWFLLRAWKVLHELAKEEWDVIHYHNFLPDGLLLGIFNWPYAKVRVMTNHSDVLLKTIDRGKSPRVFRWVVRQVNGIIGPSPELRDKSDVIRKSGQILTYIPNGVDIQRFVPGAPTKDSYELLGVSPEQKVILAVRRHDPKCGLHYLLQAIPKVVERHPNTVFCLIGDGEQTGALKRLANELKLGDSVKFVGRMSHEKLPIVLRAAYCSVLPSIYEAVSLAGLESLSCGIPVVGTNVGGIPEFIKPYQTGLLVEPNSPESLANGLIFLLDRPEERDKMSFMARQFVLSTFSWDAVAQKTMSFYQSLIQS
uniref:Glycosyl transferase family 1 n=1 Tax=uncultured Chloroflexota bacterium TaxID=166587 RepID=H5SIC0_9CHLR|nr:glycosyl transferase family 1 [uncultured Chloroflexota bacterium]BAL55906.1 glycosyl transferase family 1 [uncultured Chloroflexota bacterium]